MCTLHMIVEQEKKKLLSFNSIKKKNGRRKCYNYVEILLHVMKCYNLTFEWELQSQKILLEF